MADAPKRVPDDSAVRVALWRALHALSDAPPHVLDDRIGLALVAPDDDWQKRPDMGPFTRPFRASIVARARFVEDHLEEQVARGVAQYVILGAGLDTFAERRPDVAARLRVFEIDEPETQAWKQQRLAALGLSPPSSVRFVPVDFERGESWLARLAASGFDVEQRAGALEQRAAVGTELRTESRHSLKSSQEFCTDHFAAAGAWSGLNTGGGV